MENKGIIVGSLLRIFSEKERVILEIYSNQDKLEFSAENRFMAEEDLASHEMRNLDVIMEMEELEAILEMFKVNENDT